MPATHGHRPRKPCRPTILEDGEVVFRSRPSHFSRSAPPLACHLSSAPRGLKKKWLLVYRDSVPHPAHLLPYGLLANAHSANVVCLSSIHLQWFDWNASARTYAPKSRNRQCLGETRKTVLVQENLQVSFDLVLRIMTFSQLQCWFM